MKLKYKEYIWMLVGMTIVSSCGVDTFPESQIVTEEQKADISAAIPDRLKADVTGMFSVIGNQFCVFGATSSRDDDAGFPTVCLSQDLNGPDMISDNSNYNWFSASSKYSDRIYTYANPYMRWAVFYNQIKLANDVIKSIDSATENPVLKVYLAQAKAVRAFDYLSLAPYYQFKYKGNEDKLCVPLVLDYLLSDDPSYNPRATVKEVYEQIMKDLDAAIIGLEGYTRVAKTEIDQQVAYGLRARANLYMENWAAAAVDAEKAMTGYPFYSKEEVSQPAFNDITDANWMWGLNLTPDNFTDAYPSWPSVLGSFSGDAYSTGVGSYKDINVLLFNKIPPTDVRKGWWVDENLHSSNLSSVSWNGVSGDAVAKLVIPDVKYAYNPYTNVKFAQYGGPGSTQNAGDWCIMRSEEMLLIRVEALAMSGNVAGAKTLLESFVKGYRNPSYVCNANDATALQNEVWFQRRVELWGEGFSMSDIMRLGKPVVRHHNNKESNFPEAFKFNIKANDGYLLLRIPQRETNNNKGIPESANNNEGSQPVSGDNATLRDGITD